MSKYREKPSSTNKPLIAVGIIVAVFITYAFVSSQIAENNERLRKEAEIVRLQSDPITTSGIYTAINKQRNLSGVPALSTVSNLTESSKNICSDMVKDGYFDYTNPKTGKTLNSFIVDRQGDLYYKVYVVTIFSADVSKETATDAAMEAVKNQSQNITNPAYNSVGWEVCTDPTNENKRYVIGSLAEKADPPTPVYAPAPVYAPRPILNCTSYETMGGGTNTTCR